MTLTLQFADGTTQAALTETTIYPSGSVNYRSYAEIHLAENAMTLDELEALFKDESKTQRIHYILKEGDVICSDQVYENYVLLTGFGKKIVEATNSVTGDMIEETHLIVRLEQPTYNEQLARQIGQAYRIIREGE